MLLLLIRTNVPLSIDNIERRSNIVGDMSLEMCSVNRFRVSVILVFTEVLMVSSCDVSYLGITY